jgi:beta-glucanase (GH16 family)
MARVIPNTKYLGDSSKADWVSSGSPLSFQDNLLLTMAPDSVGTLLASTTYMWYGNVKAKFKTSRGQGVVTAFILLGDIKDEIDYEFVGADLGIAQTNYYFQGIPDYTHSANITLSDTFNNYHTYEIDWTPDTITWSVDGQVGRTKKRADTWNATTNQWDYPQTPSRVQLSLWPAGLSSNGKGTVDWAGGLVDWNSADIKNNGYYYATFESVEISCYNAKSAPGTNKNKSYTFNGYAGTNNTVVDGNGDTILGSFMATGTNMSIGAVTGTASATAASTTVETVPGLTGQNPGVNDHSSVASSAGSQATGTGTGTGTNTVSSETSAGTGFSQGTSGTSGTTKSGAEKLGANQEKVLKGSIFAGIVAVVAMMAL